MDHERKVTFFQSAVRKPTTGSTTETWMTYTCLLPSSLTFFAFHQGHITRSSTLSGCPTSGLAST